jgi:hypothetical protein
MIIGRYYADTLARYWPDWDGDGLSPHEFDPVLIEHGWAWQDKRGKQPPWADIHLVRSDDHMVVMLADGQVLDPGRDVAGCLADYETVSYIRGLFKLQRSINPTMDRQMASL